MARKWVAVLLIAAAQVAALALWFSASATVPAIVAEFGLSPSRAGLLTSAVQAGFVAGTLASAAFGLADRIESRRLLGASALAAAAANLGLLAVPMDGLWPAALRFVTGACMAGIYPVGMRMIAAWAERDLGLLIGILVGALSLGSGSPHLFHALGGVDWRVTVAATSASAALAALLIACARPGPLTRMAARFEIGAVLRGFAAPAPRLALGGYLGHMWELYAMWAWIGVYLDQSFRLAMPAAGEAASVAASLTAFASVGLGGLVGCIAAGALADRIGRTALTMGSMAASGSCAVAAGLLFGASPWLVGAVAILWGLTVTSDSAQFSASLSELSPPETVGTVLTMQTSCGFLLTLATIQVVPLLVQGWGWGLAFGMLALGPACGITSMGLLRLRPESLRLAHGRR